MKNACLKYVSVFFYAAACVGVLGAFVMGGASPSFAQNCEMYREIIMSLRSPIYGTPTVWDAIYGEDDEMTQLVSSVPLEDETVMSVGYKFSKESGNINEIVMAQLNRRGRVLKEYSFPAFKQEKPIKLLKTKDDFIVLSNFQIGREENENAARLIWYTNDGEAIAHEKVIKDKDYFYDGVNISHTPVDDGTLVSLQAINKKDKNDKHGVLIKLDDNGEVVWRRAYRVGIPNKINAAVPADGKNYIATGQILDDAGRYAGWSIKISSEGAILWQRTYRRGVFASLQHAVVADPDDPSQSGYIAVGVAEPSDEGGKAAWVMAYDFLGVPLWQRYVRLADYDLSAGWISKYEDGRFVVVANAALSRSADVNGYDHIRMFIMSPRGLLVADEAYLDGVHAHANDYVPGWDGERIVTAEVRHSMTERPLDDKNVKIYGISDGLDVNNDDDNASGIEVDDTLTNGDGIRLDELIGLNDLTDVERDYEEITSKAISKGWVFVGTAMDPYKDSCAKRQR